MGITTTVMLSWPPAANAYSTSARAAVAGSCSGAQSRDVVGVGKVVPQAVGAHHQRAPVGGGDRAAALESDHGVGFGVGAEPAGQGVRAGLYGVGLGGDAAR